MVRLPWTWTSPLKEPAMRTWPAPSIFPSIVRSEAISDSLASARSGMRRGRSWFKGVMVDISGALPVGSLGGGAAAFGSFHSAMVIPHFVGKRDDIYTGTWVEFKPMSSQLQRVNAPAIPIRGVAASRRCASAKLTAGINPELPNGDSPPVVQELQGGTRQRGRFWSRK